MKSSQANIKKIIRSEKVEHVLLIQDTTEVNFDHRRTEIGGNLGVVSNEKAIGIFSHPVIALNAKDNWVLGISACQFWSRDPKRKRKTSYQNDCEPLENKESYRWISSIRDSKKILDSVKMITAISDRESDFFAFFTEVPDEKTHILVRGKGHRTASLLGSDKLMSVTAIMEGLTVADSKKMELSQKSKTNEEKKKSLKQKLEGGQNGRAKRQATLGIKYCSLEMKKPKMTCLKKYPEKITLNCIQVEEQNPPKDQEAIKWILYTSHKIERAADAWGVVEMYRKRWLIEILFRTAKRGGYEIETIEGVNPEAIVKLCFLGLMATIKVLQLKMSKDNLEFNKPIDMLFSEQEEIAMVVMNKQLEGKTTKQKNPYEKKTLAWAYWVIGRMGGWKGYAKSEGPAGASSLKAGLDRLGQAVEIIENLRSAGVLSPKALQAIF